MKLIIQIPCLERGGDAAGDDRRPPARRSTGIDEVELLVIDDGSTDRTVEVAREHGVEHIVRLTNNKGLAAAFQAGLDACLKLGADIVVNTDADNQYSGADVAEAGGADPRRRGRHGRRRPPGRPDRALLRLQEGAAAARQLGRAAALGHRDRRHHLRLPRLQPRGGARPARRRQLHLHAGEPDPGRQDAGRGRPGRDRDQPADARVAALRLDRRLRAPQRALDPAHLRPLRAAAGLRQRRRSSSASSPSPPGCRS